MKPLKWIRRSPGLASTVHDSKMTMERWSTPESVIGLRFARNPDRPCVLSPSHRRQAASPHHSRRRWSKRPDAARAL